MSRLTSATMKFLFEEGRLIMTAPSEDDFVEGGMKLIEELLKPYMRYAPLPELRTRLDHSKEFEGLTDAQLSLRVFDLGFGCFTDGFKPHQFFFTETGYIVVLTKVTGTLDYHVEYTYVKDRDATLRRMYRMSMASSLTNSVNPMRRLTEGVDRTLKHMYKNAQRSAKLAKSFRKTTRKAVKLFKKADFQ